MPPFWCWAQDSAAAGSPPGQSLGTRVITTNRLTDDSDPETALCFDSQLGRVPSPNSSVASLTW